MPSRDWRIHTRRKGFTGMWDISYQGYTAKEAAREVARLDRTEPGYQHKAVFSGRTALEI